MGYLAGLLHVVSCAQSLRGYVSDVLPPCLPPASRQALGRQRLRYLCSLTNANHAMMPAQCLIAVLACHWLPVVDYSIGG